MSRALTDLSEEERIFRETVREFAEEKLAPLKSLSMGLIPNKNLFLLLQQFSPLMIQNLYVSFQLILPNMVIIGGTKLQHRSLKRYLSV